MIVIELESPPPALCIFACGFTDEPIDSVVPLDISTDLLGVEVLADHAALLISSKARHARAAVLGSSNRPTKRHLPATHHESQRSLNEQMRKRPSLET